MTEYLYGPVWYSTVPEFKVDWDIVTATYIVTTSELMQRCHRPVISPSAQIYESPKGNEIKEETPTNNVIYKNMYKYNKNDPIPYNMISF